MEKDKNKEEDQGSEGNEDGDRDEIKQNEETEKNGSDSDKKTEQETDRNENVINADALDEKQKNYINEIKRKGECQNNFVVIICFFEGMDSDFCV